MEDFARIAMHERGVSGILPSSVATRGSSIFFWVNAAHNEKLLIIEIEHVELQLLVRKAPR